MKLAGTDFCLDAGERPSNGVKSKIWTVSPPFPAGMRNMTRPDPGALESY